MVSTKLEKTQVPKEQEKISLISAFLDHVIMVFIFSIHFFFFLSISISFPLVQTAPVVDDLNNLQPPPDFNSTITKNCLQNPLLRYCNSTPYNLHEIFKSTVVASHLCNISKNPNCVESFPKIELHGQPKIAPLYLSFSFFWKYCPLTILSINLANNSLKGNFPSDIFHCSQIRQLDLSRNNFSGDVPIQDFSFLANLTFLNLSYNQFSESKISDKQFFERFNSSSFIHSGVVPNHGKFRIMALLLLIGFPIFVILMVIFMGWLCFWRPDFLPKFLQSKHKFTVSIIKAATNGFSRRNLVGKSRSAEIYKGLLRDGTEVKIEVYLDSISREGRRRFVEECHVLVQLCHKNTVPVLGWCDSRKFRAVITMWMEGVSVETWLSSFPPWKQRIKVLMGIIEGICYLHEEWPQVCYDLRTRNILLFDGVPLISRLKFTDHNSSTKQIYKLGVLMLEMVTNRRPLEEEFERREAGFIDWVKMQYPENLDYLIDKQMKRTHHVMDGATEAIRLGLMCADVSSGEHPSWDEISNLVNQSIAKPASPDYRSSYVSTGEGHKRVHH